MLHCVATEDRSVAKAAAEEKTTQKKTMAKKKNAGATAAAAEEEEEEDICAIASTRSRVAVCRSRAPTSTTSRAWRSCGRSTSSRRAPKPWSCRRGRAAVRGGAAPVVRAVLPLRPGREDALAPDQQALPPRARPGSANAEGGGAGLPEAQAHLGFMYMEGMSVPPNYSTSAKWSRKAADQNHAGAQFNLGVMYENGRGVPRSDVKAVKWWRKSADQGNEYAQHNLGNMYGSGLGVPQSDTSAVEWYRRAADQGHAPAQCNLGLMYKYGKGGLPQSLALTLGGTARPQSRGLQRGS